MRKLFLAATAISLSIAGTACSSKKPATTTPKTAPDAKPADPAPEAPKAEEPKAEEKTDAPATP